MAADIGGREQGAVPLSDAAGPDAAADDGLIVWDGPIDCGGVIEGGALATRDARTEDLHIVDQDGNGTCSDWAFGAEHKRSEGSISGPSHTSLRLKVPAKLAKHLAFGRSLVLVSAVLLVQTLPA
jgi:hypothetical protein